MERGLEVSPVSTQLYSLGEPLCLAGSHFPHRQKQSEHGMGMPRSFPALASMIPRLRKHIQASKIKCNKVANHTFEQKAYYYLFLHDILVELSTLVISLLPVKLSSPGSTVPDPVLTPIRVEQSLLCSQNCFFLPELPYFLSPALDRTVTMGERMNRGKW